MSNMSNEQLTNKERKQIIEGSNMIFITAYNKLSLEIGKLVSEQHECAPKMVISIGEMLSAYYDLSSVSKNTPTNLPSSKEITQVDSAGKKKRKKYITKGRWTAAEDAYLRENHGKMKLSAIASHLGRTPKAAGMRLYNTGIIVSKKNEDKDVDVLSENINI